MSVDIVGSPVVGETRGGVESIMRPAYEVLVDSCRALLTGQSHGQSIIEDQRRWFVAAVNSRATAVSTAVRLGPRTDSPTIETVAIDVPAGPPASSIQAKCTRIKTARPSKFWHLPRPYHAPQNPVRRCG